MYPLNPGSRDSCRPAAALGALMLVAAVSALIPATAQALSMQVLGSEVYVDGGARAGTSTDDLAYESGANLEIGVAVAVLVLDGRSASGSASAIASRKPFNLRPPAVETGTDLRVSARAGTDLDAEAEAIGGGSIRLQLLDDGDLAPGFGFAFNLFLNHENELDDWRLTYLVRNETLGITAFSVDSDLGPLPTSFVVGVSAGDVIRIEWYSQVSVFAENGQFHSGGLSFGSAVSPIAIPEPAPIVLGLLGLLAMGTRREARSGRRSVSGI